jgi:choline-sulfatase
MTATIIENLSTKPTVQSQFLTITNLGLGPLKTPQDQQNYLNFYGNLMKASDKYLVQMLDILEDVGLLDNTLIIRTADHGEMGLTHNGQRQKNFNFYEESLRVPLVYSNPNLYKQSFKSNALVSHVDFLPTIASIFNAPSSALAAWQGIDYSELVLNRSENSVQDPFSRTMISNRANRRPALIRRRHSTASSASARIDTNLPSTTTSRAFPQVNGRCMTV